jgi:hypothetical protein
MQSNVRSTVTSVTFGVRSWLARCWRSMPRNAVATPSPNRLGVCRCSMAAPEIRPEMVKALVEATTSIEFSDEHVAELLLQRDPGRAAGRCPTRTVTSHRETVRATSPAGVGAAQAVVEVISGIGPRA